MPRRLFRRVRCGIDERGRRIHGSRRGGDADDWARQPVYTRRHGPRHASKHHGGRPPLAARARALWAAAADTATPPVRNPLQCTQNGRSELSSHARRFVSLRPKANSSGRPAAGRLLTRPLLLPNCTGAAKRLSLALNLDTGLSGSAMVTVLSTANAVLLRSMMLVGNSAHLPTQFGSFGEDWNVAGSVLPPALQGTVVQLELQLEGNAVDIYGFQFKCV